MSRRNAAAIGIALFVVGAFGCGRGCTCISGEKSYEQLDGKVRVELVRSTHWVGGRIPGPVSDFVVRVHTTPPFDEGVACTHVDLAENDDGKLVAFRCTDTKAWTVLRIREHDVHLRECDAPVGEKRKPDFARMTTLTNAIGRILSCAAFRDPVNARQAPTLVAAIATDEGEPAAAHALAEIAKLAAPADDTPPWFDAAFAASSPARRTATLSEACPALRDDALANVGFVNLARRCAIDGSDIAEAASRRLAAILATSSDLTNDDGRALGWASILAPPSAAAGACAALARSGADGPRALAAKAVIARHETRCAPSVALVPPCGASLVCTDHLCTREEARSELAANLAAVRAIDEATGARKAEVFLELGPRVGLVAALAQAPLSIDLQRQAARLTYAIDEEGPNCGDPLKVGAPCACSTGFRTDDAICRLPLDGGIYSTGFCDLRARDDKRRILVTKACGSYLSSCDVTACCPGLICVEEKGYGSCRTPPSDAGD